jgi:iron(II)-dependent oxidoreductase
MATRVRQAVGADADLASARRRTLDLVSSEYGRPRAGAGQAAGADADLGAPGGRLAEGGGYERREWWSDEGWAWKEEYDISDCPGGHAGAPDAPVCHVSWFEADAFARSCGARLPTEAEWEKASTWGRLDGTGHVWEWTASAFSPYPGFSSHPYREYSEPFFDGRHRVLRGGSWATHPRVASPTFRNWDLPQRRQLFAGLRLARDAED